MIRLCRFFSFLLFSILLFFFAGPAHSEPATPNSQSFLVRPWAVGQSITLQTKTFNNDALVNTETTTYSIVGEEVIDGKNYLWMEIERHTKDGVIVIQKIQIRRPRVIDFENVLAMGVEHGFVPNAGIFLARRRLQKIILPGSSNHFSNEFEVAADSVSQIANSDQPSANKDLSKNFGVVTGQNLSVPAGKFKTTKFFTDLSPVDNFGTIKKNSISSFSDAWGSPDVPVWGLVKKTLKSIGTNKVVFVQETELLSFAISGVASKMEKKSRTVSRAEQKILLEKSKNTNYENLKD